MFVVSIFIYLAVLHAGHVSSMDCKYSSREYQVVLRPELLTSSFKDGISQILGELTKIEKAQMIDFNVSVSSLKFNNVSVTEYIPANNRDPTDFNVPLRFKSRQKNTNEPADIVMKTSNADPALACWPLSIAEDYVNTVESKFELDVYAENDRIIPKTGQSYTVELPLGFDRSSSINISKYLVDAANKLTFSGLSLIVVPDSIGTVTMQTAEFDIFLLGKRYKATIFLLQRATGWQSEFSFKIKNETVGWKTLLAAQKLSAEISRVRSIALSAA